MIHPLPSKRSVILTGMIAAATLFLSVDGAQAGPAEIKALNAQLASVRPGASLEDSNTTAQELADAVAAVIGANPKFKAGVVAGEALKSTAGTGQDAGEEIAEALIEVFTTSGTVNRPGLVAAVGAAAATAGAGKGASVTEVPEFAATALEGNEEGRTAALAAIKSKSGAGAILGGIASEAVDDPNAGTGTNLTADQKRIALVNGAFQDKKLAGAALDISRFVAAETDDSDAFALAVAGGTNNKLALNIATGASAGDPDNAGEIVRVLASAGDPLLRSIVLKGASKLAASVGAVADIEQISLVGKALADQIGTGALKPTAAAGLAKTLAKAILSRPITTTGANTKENKADEIAEVAAFIANGIVGNAGVSLKTAPKLFLAIIKGAVAGGKASKKQQGLAAATSYVADIAGSVALTVRNSNLSFDIKNAVADFLLDPKGKQAKAIGGTLASAVTQALTLGFGDRPSAANPGDNTSTDANQRLEDGSNPLLAVAEPETGTQDFDIRDFDPQNPI